MFGRWFTLIFVVEWTWCSDSRPTRMAAILSVVKEVSWNIRTFTKYFLKFDHFAKVQKDLGLRVKSRNGNNHLAKISYLFNDSHIADDVVYRTLKNRPLKVMFCCVEWTSTWNIHMRLYVLRLNTKVIKTVYFYFKNPYTCVQPIPSTHHTKSCGRMFTDQSIDGRVFNGKQ